jgi:ribonuclease PH
LRIIEDYYKVIQRQIKEAIRNPIQIHQDDEKRVEKIFCDILEKK